MRKHMSLLAVVALAACTPENDPVVVTESGLSPRATWNANLAAVSSVAMTGTAAVTDFGPYFDIQLAVAGGRGATNYQWRIYVGTCAAPGAQHGPNQAYPNFTTDASGGAQLTRTLAGPLNLAGAYNLRVSTVAAPVTIISCGNLAKGS